MEKVSPDLRTELPADIPVYSAIGEDGEYTRQAFSVGELPDHLRLVALQKAANVLGLEAIQFGVPIFHTLGMTRRQAEMDGRGWIMYAGADLPLDYFWHR